MRTAIEAIEVVNDLGRTETIYCVRMFEVRRDAAGLHEVELPPKYVTAAGADLAYAQGTFATRNGRRRYQALNAGSG